jgi:hypothetical protein
MLEKQYNGTITPDLPVHSSELDLNQLYTAIKQTYFELDTYLKQIVKDDSGSVCVGITNYHFLQ